MGAGKIQGERLSDENAKIYIFISSMGNRAREIMRRSKVDIKFCEPARGGRYVIGTPPVSLHSLHFRRCAHVRTCCTKAQLNRD